MALSSTPADPPSSSAGGGGAATPRLFTNTPQPTREARLPTPALPQSQPNYHLPHRPTTYPLPSQPQQPLYTAQPLPNLAPRVAANAIHPQLAAKPHEPPQGILYPVASSGRGFLPKSIRPQYADQKVTIANPGGFPSRPVVAAPYPHSNPVRSFGFPLSDSQVQAVHLIRPTHLQHTLLGSTGGMMSGMVKGVPMSAHQKISPSQPSVSDYKRHMAPRDRSRDDNFATVRDRKVRISDGSSIYALCRSWLRNGFPEESQPQYAEGVKSLPKPSPTRVADAHSPVKKEGDKEEEEEGSIENLSPTDLLERHIKRAKKVRARLREERLQRIARYKTRLALLLPPLVEQQQFRNDLAAGN